MLTIVIAIVIVINVVFVTIFLKNKKKPLAKIFGIYSQPGRWYYLKYLLMLTALTLRRFKDKYLINPETDIIRSRNIERLESLQTLSNHEKVF